MWLSIFIPVLLAVLVIVCVLLTLVVLMQRPKNEGLGAAFGSGVTENIFGAQTATVLTKATVYLGCIFFALTLLLTVLTARQSVDRRVGVLENEVRKAAASATPNATVSPAATGAPQASPGASTSSSPAASASPESSAAAKSSATPSASVAGLRTKQPDPRLLLPLASSNLLRQCPLHHNISVLSPVFCCAAAGGNVSVSAGRRWALVLSIRLSCVIRAAASSICAEADTRPIRFPTSLLRSAVKSNPRKSWKPKVH